MKKVFSFLLLNFFLINYSFAFTEYTPMPASIMKTEGLNFLDKACKYSKMFV
jgi:hypothetical protein